MHGNERAFDAAELFFTCRTYPGVGNWEQSSLLPGFSTNSPHMPLLVIVARCNGDQADEKSMGRRLLAQSCNL